MYKLIESKKIFTQQNRKIIKQGVMQ